METFLIKLFGRFENGKWGHIQTKRCQLTEAITIYTDCETSNEYCQVFYDTGMRMVNPKLTLMGLKT